jgi:undecaprenyl-diphosphatase
VDWSIFHTLNGALRGDDGAQDATVYFNSWAIFALVAIAAATWFVARPGGSLRPKLAAVSAGISAALGLAVNGLLGHVWYHARPFADHPRQTLQLVPHAPDNSFPSDHATVAFAVAFAVLFFHRRLGLLLVGGAVLVGVTRIFVGVHYPVDVAASALVGLASAALVTTAGRPYVEWVARQASRLSDPIVAAATRRFAAARRSARR